ncbi:MAG: recombinase family protein [Planctomycetes bacterium]|nr:recombinase family protein [Planctomycetota bacterium]
MKRTNKAHQNHAVAYLRVSTTEQADEGVSLEAQEAALRAYCTMRGLELVEVITDPGVSAGKPLAAREGGRRVLDLVRTGKAGAVVAYKLDRLFRDCADCLTVTATWDRTNVALHLVDLGGQAVDTSTAMGRFFLTVMAGAAELERNVIRERTAMAMSHKRTRREYCGGEAPYGWRIDGAHLVPHDAEQTVMRCARELREAGLSLRKIGVELEVRGMLPRCGRKWHAVTVRSLVNGDLETRNPETQEGVA